MSAALEGLNELIGRVQLQQVLFSALQVFEQRFACHSLVFANDQRETRLAVVGCLQLGFERILGGIVFHPDAAQAELAEQRQCQLLSRGPMVMR